MVYMWRLQQEKITNELFYLISSYVASNAKEHDLQDKNIEYLNISSTISICPK